MVSSIKFVHQAFVARGSGKLDFAEELKRIKPDFSLLILMVTVRKKELLLKGWVYVML